MVAETLTPGILLKVRYPYKFLVGLGSFLLKLYPVFTPMRYVFYKLVTDLQHISL